MRIVAPLPTSTKLLVPCSGVPRPGLRNQLCPTLPSPPSCLGGGATRNRRSADVSSSWQPSKMSGAWRPCQTIPKSCPQTFGSSKLNTLPPKRTMGAKYTCSWLAHLPPLPAELFPNPSLLLPPRARWSSASSPFVDRDWAEAFGID